METILLWWINVLSAVLACFQHLMSGWKLEIEPFYSGTNEGWINSRPSLEFNEKGEIIGMRKCPALYLDSECPANYLQEQWKDHIVCTALFCAVLFVHVVLVLILTEDQ